MASEFTFIQSLLEEDVIENGMPLIFKGVVTHDIKKIYTAMAENKISNSNKPDAIRRKVFRVLVECIENITKHSDEVVEYEKKQIGEGLFIVGEQKDHYYIIVGNKIANEKAKILVEHITQINSSDKEGLNKMHKEQILHGELSEKGGAGLGLIEIARKSGSKIEYNLKDVNADMEFFMMKVKIPF